MIALARKNAIISAIISPTTTDTEITATVTTDFQAEITPEAAPVAEKAPAVDSTVDPVVDNQAPDSFAAKKKDEEDELDTFKNNIYIVFVECETPGNIGFLARTMANFGLKNLVLIKIIKIIYLFLVEI